MYTLRRFLISYSPLIVLALLFVFPRIGRFVFSNFSIVLGLFFLWMGGWVLVLIGQDIRRKGAQWWDGLYMSASVGMPWIRTMIIAGRNCTVSFFVGLVVGAGPYFLLVAPAITRSHTTDLPINHIARTIWLTMFALLQIYAGYRAFLRLGRRAWLYGTSAVVTFAVMFGIFVVAYPCSGYLCRQRTGQILVDYTQHPLQTYGSLALIGAALGVGIFLGSVLASLRKHKT